MGKAIDYLSGISSFAPCKFLLTPCSPGQSSNLAVDEISPKALTLTRYVPRMFHFLRALPLES